MTCNFSKMGNQSPVNQRSQEGVVHSSWSREEQIKRRRAKKAIDSEFTYTLRSAGFQHMHPVGEPLNSFTPRWLHKTLNKFSINFFAVMMLLFGDHRPLATEAGRAETATHG